MSTENFSIENIRLVVGLGNIGEKYSKTRHNAGFIFVDSLIHKMGIPEMWHESGKLKSIFSEIYLDKNDSKIILAKPTTLMNSSGEAVQALSKYFKITDEQILVAHDDLDLELGNNKLQFAKGPKVHNGISSINSYMGKNYWRLRIGIENRDNQVNNVPGIRYVLERFKSDEKSILIESFSSVFQKFF